MANRPNVHLILTDQLRYNALSCCGARGADAEPGPLAARPGFALRTATRNLLQLVRGKPGDGFGGAAICCYRDSAMFDTKRYAPCPIHATMLRQERYKLNLYRLYRGGPVVRDRVEGELYDIARDAEVLDNHWDDGDHAGGAGG